MVSRLPAAARASETRLLFAFAPLAAILMAALEGHGRGSAIDLRQRCLPGSGAVQRFPGRHLAWRRLVRGRFRSGGGAALAGASLAPFKSVSCVLARRAGDDAAAAGAGAKFR